MHTLQFRPTAKLIRALLFITMICMLAIPPRVLIAFAPDRAPLVQRATAASNLAVHPAPNAVTSDSLFTDYYPALRTARAPQWLRAGTRVTYRFASASIAQTRGDPASSGAGLIQYDVIAQNRRNVVFLANFINTEIQGALPVFLNYKATLPGVGDFWFSPTVLANVETSNDPDFQVTRMPMTVEGVTYNVVRMQSTTRTNQGSGEEVWAFDVESGIAVFYRQALYRRDGSQSSGTTVTLLASRQVRIPWRTASVPDWVESGLEWQFAGSQTLDVGVGNPVSLPVNSIIRITDVGALWSEQTQQTFLYGRDNGTDLSATGTMQLFGGMWLPARALTTLRTGTVLDQDPLTGIEIRVVQANRQTVVMAAVGPGHLSQLTYSVHTGQLIGIYTESRTPAGTLYTTQEVVQ